MYINWYYSPLPQCCHMKLPLLRWAPVVKSSARPATNELELPRYYFIVGVLPAVVATPPASSSLQLGCVFLVNAAILTLALTRLLALSTYANKIISIKFVTQRERLLTRKCVSTVSTFENTPLAFISLLQSRLERSTAWPAVPNTSR